MRVPLTLLVLLLFGPQDVDEIASGADRLLKEGDLDGAIAAYTRVLELKPGLVGAYSNRGVAKLRKGDLDGAIVDFSRAIHLNPKMVAAFSNRALARLKKGDNDGALADYGEILGLDPKNVDALLGRAGIWLETFSYAKSVEEYKRAIALDPKNIDAHLNLADGQYKSKDYAAAVATLTRCIEFAPKDWRPYAERARMKSERHEYDAALLDCDAAEKLAPDVVDVHFHRGACLVGKSQWKEAEATYRKALKAAPEGWYWRQRLEVLIDVLPDVQGGPAGLAPFQRLLQKGSALHASGETEKAVRLLQEVVRMDAGSADAHETLAFAYAKLNRIRDVLDEVCTVAELRGSITPALRRIQMHSGVLDALRWLAAHQMKDGRWSCDAFGENCRKDCPPKCGTPGVAGQDLKATSLALLALHGAGYAHLSKDNYDGKPMGTTIRDGLQWMISRQGPDGSFGARATLTVEDQAQAALALSEAYGLTAAAHLKDPAQKAVDALVSWRRKGQGWPARPGAGSPDVASTGWALMALRSAQISELKVLQADVDEGYGWLQKNAKGKGAVLAAAAGAYLGIKPIEKGVEAALKVIAAAPPGKKPEEQDAEFSFLSAMTLRLAENGPLWGDWKKAALAALLPQSQFVEGGAGCPSGSWDGTGPVNGPRGRVITTAFQALVFEVHYGYANTFCTAAPEPAKK